MQCSLKTEGKTAIVHVVGKLDTTTASDFDAFIHEVAGSSSVHCILVFDKLVYISSAGLRSVLMAAKMFSGKKGKLVLVGLSGPVKEVFKLSGFDRVLKSTATEAEAMNEILASGD